MLLALSLLPALGATLMRAADGVIFDPAIGSPALVAAALLSAATFACFCVHHSPVATHLSLLLAFAAFAYRADGSLPTAAIECGGGRCDVLVTGGNSGIGAAAAAAMAAQGHRVRIACRSAAKCTAAAEAMGVDAAEAVLDLSDLDGVRAFAASVAGTVDVVVANAGFVPWGNSTAAAAAGWESGLGAMHLGHFELVRRLHGAGKLAPGARVVAVSSDAFRFGAFHPSLHASPGGEGDLRGEHTVGCGMPLCFGGQGGGAYARAKLANVLWAREMPRRLGVLASSVHPGMVATPLAQSMAPDLGAALNTVQHAYERVALRSAADSAKVILLAVQHASAEGPFLNARGAPLPAELLTPEAADDAAAARLWDVSALAVE